MAREQEWMGILLNQHKLCANLLMDGVLESTNNQIRSHFSNLMNQTVQHQKQIFDVMTQKGWYQVAPAPQDEFTRIQQSVSSIQQQMH